MSILDRRLVTRPIGRTSPGVAAVALAAVALAALGVIGCAARDPIDRVVIDIEAGRVTPGTRIPIAGTVTGTSGNGELMFVNDGTGGIALEQASGLTPGHHVVIEAEP